MTKQDRKDLSNIVNIFNYICYRHRSRNTCNGCPFHNKMMNACSQGYILETFNIHNINLTEIWRKEHNAD